MIIGASPSGTGGGIKSTTVSCIVGIIKSVFSYPKEYINYSIPSRNIDKVLHKKKKRSLSNRHIRSPSKDKVMRSEVSTLKTLSNRENMTIGDDLNKILGDIFKIKLMGRAIPFDRIIHAMATFSFYFIILFIGVLFLLISEPFSFEQVFLRPLPAWVLLD